jgi:micrococcal nuclease
VNDPYWRRCAPVRVVDGDTVVLAIDLGWNVVTTHMVRLLDVNTPELRRPTAEAGGAARDYTAGWFAAHAAHAARVDAAWPFTERSEKADSFGRYLCRVECGLGHSLGADLVAAGHAVPFMEGG